MSHFCRLRAYFKAVKEMKPLVDNYYLGIHPIFSSSCYVSLQSGRHDVFPLVPLSLWFLSQICGQLGADFKGQIQPFVDNCQIRSSSFRLHLRFLWKSGSHVLSLISARDRFQNMLSWQAGEAFSMFSFKANVSQNKCYYLFMKILVLRRIPAMLVTCLSPGSVSQRAKIAP